MRVDLRFTNRTIFNFENRINFQLRYIEVGEGVLAVGPPAPLIIYSPSRLKSSFMSFDTSIWRA